MRVRRARTSIVVAVALSLALSTVGLSPAVAAPSLDTYTSPRSFSPNGDGNEDILAATFRLDSPANVTAVVHDADGTDVRTLTTDQSYPSGYVRLTWDGYTDAGSIAPDGDYTVDATAVAADGVPATASLTTAVDTRVPGELTAPEAGATLAGRPRFEVTPTEGSPEMARVDLYLQSDPSASFSVYNASPDGAWRTTYPMGGLSQGPATLRATMRWTDEFGQSHTFTAAPVEVAIDPVAIPLEASLDPVEGLAPLTTTLHLITSDPNDLALAVNINWGDGDQQQATVQNPYDPIALEHEFTEPGTYNVFVSVSNGEGGYASQTIPLTVGGAPNEAPSLNMAVTPASGAAPLDVSVALDATDPDNDDLTYRVDFGDGSDPVSGPVGAEPLAYNYSKVGTYLVRASVSDGRLSAVRSTRVEVILAEPLKANAGDDVSVVVGSAVHFDASASRPAAGIEAVRWDFGDGSTADDATVDHTFQETGTFEVTLTVSAGGESDTDTATVTVLPVPTEPGLAVTILDASSAVVPGAEVLVIASDGTRHAAVTTDSGRAVLRSLPDGDYTAYAWKQGYLPATGPVTVADGSGSAELRLQPGELAATELTSKRMTYEEILAAGIDPDDPENQNLYQFEVHLAFGPFPPVTIWGIGGGTGGVGGGGGGTGGGGGGFYRFAVGGVAVSCEDVCSVPIGSDYRATVRMSGSNLVWMIIPGRAKWLKEFFSVQMMVTNLADPAFTLANGAATLTLPAGLSLAPTTQAQRLTQALADIPGGQAGTASWVVRGDVEGYYDLEAHYSASLEPLGTTFSSTAVTKDPLHVWGGSALKMTVDTDDKAFKGIPYHVTFTLENVADVPLYNASLELLKEGKLNYIYQPREQLKVSTAALQPGETLSHEYVLIPTISGVLDLGESFIVQTAGNAAVPGTITSHPAVITAKTAKQFTAYRYGSGVGFTWEPVDGAEDYQIYNTPDEDTDFGPDPLPTRGTDLGGRSSAFVAAEDPEMLDDLYALSFRSSGKADMAHPLARPGSGVKYPIVGVNTSCRTDQVQVTVSDPLFAVESFKVTPSDGGPDITGVPTAQGDGQATFTFTMDRSTIFQEPGFREYEVTVTNSIGETATGWANAEPCAEAVVLAMGLNSSLAFSETYSIEETACDNLKRGGDAFNAQAATNACVEGAAASDPRGNLVAYFEREGFDPGETRSSVNRTLLEFSYGGASVGCTAVGPILVPADYPASLTYVEMVSQLSVDRIDTATRFYKALKEYSDCWREKHGKALRYMVVGHSMGGYEALSLGEAALKDGRPDLFTKIVTVDGAVHPLMVLQTIDPGSCALPDDWGPGGLANDTLDAAAVVARQDRRVVYLNAAIWVAQGFRSQEEVRAEDIRRLQGAGMQVATVTNLLDQCLQTPVTINEAANETQIWSIDAGATGAARHSATIKAHDTPVEMPGYPLASFMDGFLFDHVTSSTAVVAAAGVLGGGAGAMAAPVRSEVSDVATGSSVITGRLVLAGSGAPVAGGQVVAAGADGDRSGTVAEDGTFRIDRLSAGDYRIHVLPFHEKVAGRWLGGTSRDTATVFTLDGQLDLGDVSGLAYADLEVALTHEDGTPVTDGGGVLSDQDGHIYAHAAVDSAGRLRLAAPPGRYDLLVGSMTTRPTTVQVTLGATGTVDVELPAAARAGAEVLDETGEGVPGVLVGLYSQGELIQAGSTGADGRYLFLGLDEGVYEVKYFEPYSRFQAPEGPTQVTSTNESDPDAGYALLVAGTTGNSDSTPPQIVANVSGAAGGSDWFTSDVEVSWTVEDAESGITSASGCDTVSVLEDTEGVTFTCEATSAGGNSTESVTVKRDATAPVLECPAEVPEFLRGREGTVTATVSDALSGPAQEVASSSVDTGEVGESVVLMEVADVAGNTGSVECAYRILLPPPPVAVDDEATTDEDTVVVADVLDNDSDPHGDALQVVGVNTEGTVGAVEVAGDGGVSYHPRGQFDGLAPGEQATDTFSYTISDERDGEPDGQAEATVTVTVTGVDDEPVVAVDVEEVSAQYSDRFPAVSVTASDVDSAALKLSASGLPGGVSLTDEACAPAGDGVQCSATLAGTVLGDPGVFDAIVRAADATQSVRAPLAVTVVPEDARVWAAKSNVKTVTVARPGGDSPVFELEVGLAEAQPDVDADLALPGDPATATAAGLRLVPVGPGPSAEPVEDCTSRATGEGYDRVVRVVCQFDEVPVNAYAVEATATGTYRGAATGVLVVTDPSLGGSSGSGTFTWPDTDEATSFAYSVAPNKKGKNLQGGLLLVRDTPEGAFELRSNALGGLAVGEQDGVGWASFTGKATYLEPGWGDRMGNHTFTAHFQDTAQIEGAVDAAWIQVRDKDGELVGGLSLPGSGSSDSIPLNDGDVIVPAPAVQPRNKK